MPKSIFDIFFEMVSVIFKDFYMFYSIFSNKVKKPCFSKKFLYYSNKIKNGHF